MPTPTPLPITALPPADMLTGSELFPLVQQGVVSKVELADLYASLASDTYDVA